MVGDGQYSGFSRSQFCNELLKVNEMVANARRALYTSGKSTLTTDGPTMHGLKLGNLWARNRVCRFHLDTQELGFETEVGVHVACSVLKQRAEVGWTIICCAVVAAQVS